MAWLPYFTSTSIQQVSNLACTQHETLDAKNYSEELLNLIYMSATATSDEEAKKKVCSHKGFRLQCTVILCRRGG